MNTGSTSNIEFSATPPHAAIALATAPTPRTMSIMRVDGTPLVTIDLASGEIEYGSNYTPDDAAKAFWQALGLMGAGRFSA